MKKLQKNNIFCEIIRTIYIDEAKKLRNIFKNSNSTLLKDEKAFNNWQESVIDTSINNISKQIAVEIQKILKNLSVASLCQQPSTKVSGLLD